MSELGSALEPYRAESLPEVPDARIEQDFAELQRAAEVIELERMRRLAEIERRGLYERDGHVSVAAWLSDRFGVGWASARDAVRMARGLEQMPGTRQALAAGEVTVSAARVLVDARDGDPEGFGRAEPALVDAARIHSVSELRRVVARWCELREQERGMDRQERLWARRSLHASVTLGGMVRLDGSLDPEGGESLLTALRAVLDAEARSRVGDAGRAGRALGAAGRRAAHTGDPAVHAAGVIVRDRGCRFPGCGRPHTWCDAHHVEHWADGGPTSAANLLLLCRAHHRMVHRRGGFTLELVDGVAVFRRPDGSRLEERAPP